MCRSSRCGLPPRGSFGLCLHHSYTYSPAPLGRPGVPHVLQGPEPLPGGPPYYGGGPPGSNSPYPVGHPHQPPGGAPGGHGPPSEGWRATRMGARARGTGPTGEQPPGGMGVLRRPASAATDREGSGGPAPGPPPATAPTMQRGPRAPFLDIPCVCTRARCALPPSRLHPSPGRPPPSPHPGSARSPSVHGHPNPGAAPGPRPVASRQLADRAGRAPSRAPSCPGPRPPALARTAHPPPPTGQWPPTTRAGVRLRASPRPLHPPAPAPVAAAAALRPTPYTLLTVRRRVERSHQTRARPISRESSRVESSPARESSSGVQLGSCDTLGPQRACTVARVRRLLTDSPAPLGHGRCLPTPAGPAPGPGGRPTPRRSGSHHRPPTGQSGPPVADAVRPPRRPCQAANWSGAPGRAAGPAAADRRRCPPISVCQLASASGHAAQRGGRPRRSPVSGLPLPPSRPPALPEAMMGRCVCTNLAKDRADAQRLVATRLLDRLHDPLGHFSRLQRIHPRAR